MQTFTCVRCGGIFKRLPKEINRGRTKFCGRTCSDIHKKEAADKHASMVLRLGKKQCKQCNKYLGLDNFPPSTTSRTGFNSYCRPCTRVKNRLADKKRSDSRKIYSRIAYLKRVYDLTQQDYDKLLKQQNGGCYICASTSRLNIDHCHKTGRVRGILCDKCNRGLGLFYDSPKSLRTAAAYLTK